MSDEALMPSDDAVATPAQRSPGQQLAERRQAAGWSIEQVAAQLKLSPRQIDALESDRLDALPGATVARGFIRTYARLLNLDPAPLLATINAEIRSPIESIGQQKPLSAPFSETRLPSMHPPKASWPWLPVLLLAGVVVAAVWGAQRIDWHSVLPETTMAWFQASNAVAPTPPATAGAATEPPAAPVEAESAAPVAEPVPPPVEAAAPAAPEPPQPAPTLAAAAPEPEPAPAPAPVRAAAGGNELNLTVHEDSWIEIKRQDSSVMVSRLAKAGTTETFEIAEPVLLVIGNVAGVEASLRNIPLDLKSATSTNVARINLK